MKSNRRHIRRRRRERGPRKGSIAIAVLLSILVLVVGSALFLIALLLGRVDFISAEIKEEPVNLQTLQEQYVRVLDHEAGEDTEEIQLADQMLTNQQALPSSILFLDGAEHSLLRIADQSNLRGGTFRDQFYLVTYFPETKRINLLELPNTLYLKGPEIAPDQLQAYTNYAGIQFVQKALENLFAVPIPTILEFEIGTLLHRFEGVDSLPIYLTEQEAIAINLQIKDQENRLAEGSKTTDLDLTLLPEKEGTYDLTTAQALAYWRLGDIDQSPSRSERRAILLDTWINDYLDLGFADFRRSVVSLDAFADALATNLHIVELLETFFSLKEKIQAEFVYFDLNDPELYDSFNRYGNELTCYYPRELQQYFHDFVLEEAGYTKP